MNTGWRGVLLCLEHGVHTAQRRLPHTRVRIWLSHGIHAVPPVLAPRTSRAPAPPPDSPRLATPSSVTSSRQFRVRDSLARRSVGCPATHPSRSREPAESRLFSSSSAGAPSAPAGPLARQAATNPPSCSWLWGSPRSSPRLRFGSASVRVSVPPNWPLSLGSYSARWPQSGVAAQTRIGACPATAHPAWLTFGVLSGQRLPARSRHQSR